MTQQTFRRSRWVVAFAATGVLALSACSAGGGGDDAGASAEPADSFTFSYAKADDTANYYEPLLQEYQQATGVSVEVIPIIADTYNQQLSTQLQAGNATDLFMVLPGTGQPASAGRLAGAQLLAPLDAASAAVVKDGTDALYGVDGKIYAQPEALTVTSLLWNSLAAKDAGITSFPTTFDDLLADCGTARAAGKTFFVVAGTVPINLGLLAEGMSATRVYAETPDWDAQRAAGSVTFADSGWRDVLTDFVKMNDAKCFQDGAAGGSFDAITGGLLGGTAIGATIPGQAALGLNAAGAGAVSLDVQAFPPADGGKPWVIASPLYGWAINAKADAGKRAAAQKFLDWAAQPENAVKFANDAGAIPVTGADTAEPLPVYAAVADLVSNGSFSSEPAANWPDPAVYDALGTGMQGLLTGQTTVDGVLSAMDAAWPQ